MNVKIELVKGGQMPKKAHALDSCFDVFVRKIEHLPKCIVCYLGFKMEIPEGYEAEIRARSSISHKYDLVLGNGVGTIDESYRGEWQARFKVVPPNLLHPDENVYQNYFFENGEPKLEHFIVGERCAQIKLVKKGVDVKFYEGVVSAETDRGEGGHGSTGS